MPGTGVPIPTPNMEVPMPNMGVPIMLAAAVPAAVTTAEGGEPPPAAATAAGLDAVAVEVVAEAWCADATDFIVVTIWDVLAIFPSADTCMSRNNNERKPAMSYARSAAHQHTRTINTCARTLTPLALPTH